MSIELLSSDVQAYLRSGVAITSITQCVEELVLNALDSGASCVAVRVDLNCFKVQVVDNGSGVPKEQLQVMGNRYCTSKCHSVKDLKNLTHFGYRGEALSSIRDACRVLEITSRFKLTDKTYCKIFQNGKSLGVTESVIVRPSVGTTVTVHDLFSSFPVRQKVVNKNYEVERIREMLEGVSLIRSGVSFTLRNDTVGQVILSTKKTSSMRKTFSQLYDTSRADMLVEVQGEKGIFQIHGYFGREGHSRKNIQFVYINGRIVKKTKIHKLLSKMLTNLPSLKQKSRQYSDSPDMKTNKPNPFFSPPKFSEAYPVFIVQVKCPLKEYDITFEPTKTMVEFRDWDSLLSCVEETTKAFLDKENVITKPDKKDPPVAGSENVEQAVSVISTDNMKDVLTSKAAKRPAKVGNDDASMVKKSKQHDELKSEEQETSADELERSTVEDTEVFKTPVNTETVVCRAAIGLGIRRVRLPVDQDSTDSSQIDSSFSSCDTPVALTDEDVKKGQIQKIVENIDTSCRKSHTVSSLSKFRQSVGRLSSAKTSCISVDESLKKFNKVFPSGRNYSDKSWYSSLQKFRSRCVGASNHLAAEDTELVRKTEPVVDSCAFSAEDKEHGIKDMPLLSEESSMVSLENESKRNPECIDGNVVLTNPLCSDNFDGFQPFIRSTGSASGHSVTPESGKQPRDVVNIYKDIENEVQYTSSQETTHISDRQTDRNDDDPEEEPKYTAVPLVHKETYLIDAAAYVTAEDHNTLIPNNCDNIETCDKYSIVYETSYASDVPSDTHVCDINETVENEENSLQKKTDSQFTSGIQEENSEPVSSDSNVLPYSTQTFVPVLNLNKELTDVGSSFPSDVLENKCRTPESMGFSPTLETEVFTCKSTGTQKIEGFEGNDESTFCNSRQIRDDSDRLLENKEVENPDDMIEVKTQKRTDAVTEKFCPIPGDTSKENQSSENVTCKSVSVSQLLRSPAGSTGRNGLTPETAAVQSMEEFSNNTQVTFDDIFSLTLSGENTVKTVDDKNTIQAKSEEIQSAESGTENGENDYGNNYNLNTTRNVHGKSGGEQQLHSSSSGQQERLGLWPDSPQSLSDSAIVEAEMVVENKGLFTCQPCTVVKTTTINQKGREGPTCSTSEDSDSSITVQDDKQIVPVYIRLIKDGESEEFQNNESLDAWYRNLETEVSAPPEVLQSRKPADLVKQFHSCRFSKESLRSVQVLGQLDRKFIACLMKAEDHHETDEKGPVLVLIDQHAAHERIRLEVLTEDAFRHDNKDSVLAPFGVEPPQSISFLEHEVRTILSLQEHYRKLGISLKKEAPTKLLISSVPDCMVDKEKNNKIYWSTVQVLIREHISVFMSTQVSYGVLPQTIHKVLCSQACHGAIKFGDKLGLEECKKLIKDLCLCDLPFQCAHGRPSVMPLFHTQRLTELSVTQCKSKPNLWKITQALKKRAGAKEDS